MKESNDVRQPSFYLIYRLNKDDAKKSEYGPHSHSYQGQKAAASKAHDQANHRHENIEQGVYSEPRRKTLIFKEPNGNISKELEDQFDHALPEAFEKNFE